MSDKFILNDKSEAVPCDDLMEWARWLETADRHVAQEVIGDVRVSTVFLGFDHNIFGDRPLLFETIIFGGEHDGHRERCSTWAEAEKMHAEALDLVRRKLN